MTLKSSPSASKFRWSIANSQGWSVCPVYALSKVQWYFKILLHLKQGDTITLKSKGSFGQLK